MYTGGGIISMPDAKFDDSLYDITIVRMMPRFKMLRFLNNLKSGKQNDDKKLIRLRASEVEISSYPTSGIEIDGEALGMLPAKFSILPMSLRFVCIKQDQHL